MIRKCTDADHAGMFAVINDAAQAYKGFIPDDCWHEPYMSLDELRHEISDGVEFWGFERGDRLIGIMGFQDKGDVTLIRHAYVRTAERKKGIGTILLRHLEMLTTRPVLIGTWGAATWAIGFYVKNGYRQVSKAEKERLLRKYWSIPERQVETSVVLEQIHRSSRP